MGKMMTGSAGMAAETGTAVVERAALAATVATVAKTETAAEALTLQVGGG